MVMCKWPLPCSTCLPPAAVVVEVGSATVTEAGVLPPQPASAPSATRPATIALKATPVRHESDAGNASPVAIHVEGALAPGKADISEARKRHLPGVAAAVPRTARQPPKATEVAPAIPPSRPLLLHMQRICGPLVIGVLGIVATTCGIHDAGETLLVRWSRRQSFHPACAFLIVGAHVSMIGRSSRAALLIGQHSRHVGRMDDEFDWRQVQAESDATFAATKSHEADFLGLDEAEAVALAERLSIKLRIIREDRTALHLDFWPNRMTLDLRSGRVTRADAG